MNKTVVITGAGSGVGRAAALALARDNWRVALVGRREELLRETVGCAGSQRDQFLVCPCDIGRADAVTAMARMVLEKFGVVEALINAAGTNAPNRSLEVLSFSQNFKLFIFCHNNLKLETQNSKQIFNGSTTIRIAN